MRVLGAWVTGIILIAALVVIGKDNEVVGTIFDDSTKMLGTAMGGNG